MLIGGPNERNDYHVNETEVRVFSDEDRRHQKGISSPRGIRSGSISGRVICFSKSLMALNSEISRSQRALSSCFRVHFFCSTLVCCLTLDAL